METLRDRINRHESVPYVYNYPPTRLYQPLKHFSLADVVCTKKINLYIHVPFCEQRCTFCGYLTIIESSDTARRRYVEALCTELRLYAPLLAKHTIASINFGGGTPSILLFDEVQCILQTIEHINPRVGATAQEISIEATPETVEREKFRAYRALGINRVSVGVQTLDAAEIEVVKRHNLAPVSEQALGVLQEIGFPNVCVDLMYGLPHQTIASWKKTVDGVVAFRPSTVELYKTVTIPGTALALRGTSIMSREEQSACYQYAREEFLVRGYRQDCHLRFVLPGRGGYRQQENVFALQSLIGVGVGARSYTERLHYRNVYDTRQPRRALDRYLERVEAGELPVESGVTLPDDELMRRYVVHQFEHLHTEDFQERFGRSIKDVFPEECEYLLREGYWYDNGNTLVLALEMFNFRDLIAQEFFSSAVRASEKTYYDPDLVTIRLPR